MEESTDSYPCSWVENYFETEKLLTTPMPPLKESYWGTPVYLIQSDVYADASTEEGGNIVYGTLKYLDEGQLVTDWGEGNFLALYFQVPPEATSCKVGLVPSESGMPLQELDEEKDGVFKITNKDTQKLVVETSNGKRKLRQEFDLSNLICQTK